MKKRVVAKVKYCYSENELNDVLSTLSLSDNEYPKLRNILYIQNEKDTEVIRTLGGREYEPTVEMKNYIIAIVEYLDVVKIEDSNLIGLN